MNQDDLKLRPMTKASLVWDQLGGQDPEKFSIEKALKPCFPTLCKTLIQHQEYFSSASLCLRFIANRGLMRFEFREKTLVNKKIR